jgi:hypothetical protein
MMESKSVIFRLINFESLSTTDGVAPAIVSSEMSKGLQTIGLSGTEWSAIRPDWEFATYLG